MNPAGFGEKIEPRTESSLDAEGAGRLRPGATIVREPRVIPGIGPCCDRAGRDIAP